MSQKEKALRRRCRDDLNFFARKCLKIRTKAGDIAPLVLNRPQIYVQEKLEAQLAATGMVRAIIVKGRKQGCCHSPDMRVLTANYQWVRIGDVIPGQRLIGVDEYGTGSTAIGRVNHRRFRTVTIEAKASLRKEAFEIYFDNGLRLVATAEHKYLCRQRGGPATSWREVEKTKIGDFVRVVCPPPTQEGQSFEDGWFSGILDGEGCIRNTGSPRLSVNQNDGPILQRAKDYLSDLGIKYGEVLDSRPNGSGLTFGMARTKPCHRIDIHSVADIITVLAKTRPMRFCAEGLLDGHELPGKGKRSESTAWACVVSIKSVGEIDVVDLQTSSQTFICEGAVSHNSTLIAARHYQKVTHRTGFKAYILTHLADATETLFGMVDRFHEHNNPLVKPVTGASNSTELAFPVLDAGYKVGTAGSANVGRSDTIQLFHGSEVGFWPKAEDHAAGILQAVPLERGTEIILESTVNGLGNFFHKTWRDAIAGTNGYIAIFIPWFWSDEYRMAVPDDFEMTPDDLIYQAAHGLDMEQMAWRQLNITILGSEWKFMQEFPATPEEAFQSSGEGAYIKPVLVAKARRTRITAQAYIPIIVGIDPARGGRDKTGVIDRQGRKAGGNVNEYWDEANIERLCGKVVQLIKRIKPKKVVIDATEGTGSALVDLLVELGYSKIVVGVKFSEAAIEEGLYLNRRAEMWANLLEWLSNPLGVELPEFDDDLQAEICAAVWGAGATHHTRSGLLCIEAKEHIVKRLKRSPDKADALCMTFAVQIVAAKPDGPPIPTFAVDPRTNY